MHTTSLEMSKRLKEAGWEKATARRYYEGFYKGNVQKEWRECEAFFPPLDLSITGRWLPAPILTEILEELPDHWTIYHTAKVTSFHWQIGMEQIQSMFVEAPFNPCDAAAEVWLRVKGGSQ